MLYNISTIGLCHDVHETSFKIIKVRFVLSSNNRYPPQLPDVSFNDLTQVRIRIDEKRRAPQNFCKVTKAIMVQNLFREVSSHSDVRRISGRKSFDLLQPFHCPFWEFRDGIFDIALRTKTKRNKLGVFELRQACRPAGLVRMHSQHVSRWEYCRSGELVQICCVGLV